MAEGLGGLGLATLVSELGGGQGETNERQKGR